MCSGRFSERRMTQAKGSTSTGLLLKSTLTTEAGMNRMDIW